MNQIIHSAAVKPDLPGRILIVDDDPIVAGMLGVSLSTAGHEIIEVYSGEEALSLFAEQNGKPPPDIVFLDIDMGRGIDGYETCRRLRALEVARELPVIFLSGHDELDDRMRAYDAGGSDFIAKPFVPDEVLRKAKLAVRHKRQQEAVEKENSDSVEMTKAILASLGEAEVMIKFSRGALGCRTQRALAALTIESMGNFGINCHVQLRTPTEVLTLTQRGPASPLEESVIERSRTMDRIFSFSNRLVVNDQNVSLLVINMPVADREMCGRIRDFAAITAEVAELALGNIALRNDAIQRADELRTLAEYSRKAVEMLRNSYRETQVATRVEMANMLDRVENMYAFLGLTNVQENTVTHTVSDSVNRVLTLLEGNNELDHYFGNIVKDLTKASEYVISQEDEAPLAVEIW